MNQSFTQSIKSKDSNLALYSCTVYLCKFAQILHIVLSCSNKSLSCSNKSVPIWTFCVFNLVQCAIMTLLGKMCEEEKKSSRGRRTAATAESKQINKTRLTCHVHSVSGFPGAGYGRGPGVHRCESWWPSGRQPLPIRPHWPLVCAQSRQRPSPCCLSLVWCRHAQG